MSTFPISQNEQFLKTWSASLNDEVFKSPCAPVPIPDDTAIARALKSLKVHAAKHPQKAAVIEAADHSRCLTYQQIQDRALSFAAFLISRGFSAGDRVTVALPNSIEWPVVNLGTWAAGGSVVAAREAFKLHEHVHQLRDSCSTAIVVTEQSLDTVIHAVQQCPTVKIIVCVRSSARSLPLGVADFEEALLHAPLREITQVKPDSECLILYSSGTTGLPKGVIHTHRTVMCTLDMMSSHWHNYIIPVLTGSGQVDWYEELQVQAYAYYHVSGFMFSNWYLLMGSPVVLMKTFDGEIYLDAIEKFKPRFLGVSPPIFAYLAKDSFGKKSPMSSVQMIVSGAAPLSKELCDEFQASHPNFDYIVQLYGMTEVTVSHLPLLFEKGVNAAAGVHTAFYEQKIVNPDTLKACKQGERGEVWLRGVQRTKGYLNKEEATKELIDNEGWLHTGDIGYVDERGLMYIVDRLKELIKVNYNTQTMQVAPAQIEGILLSHRKIRDAAVIGITINQRVGELIRAFVVRAEETLTCEEVEGLVEDNLAAYQRITGGVYFIDEIPRAPAGKILRRVLRELQTT
ncbi:hypothetical protein PMAYCL1PPCAC_19785 [Pristionchus mayeri]|uniref:AMP-binding protein n=1 Tax=Pristionchus mayeri TaxID=1317129 RepID=A0AAN5I2Z2_9BILA|nr:hypothetical protein PMAYCL1PPCAC_19785 [Pristionchus mayeri]